MSMIGLWMSTDLQLDDPISEQIHDHLAYAGRIKVAKICDVMKRKDATTNEKTSLIVTECTEECENTIRTVLSSQDVCKRTIRNQRSTPLDPRRLRELEKLSDDYKTTTLREYFVLYNNDPNRNDRILAFAN